MSNILITGAGGDIGAACAALFAEKGHNLFLTYNRSETAAISLKESLTSKYNVSIYLYKADASNPQEVKACVDNALQKLGHIDLLVNNAGISHIGLDQELTSEEWLHICNSNLSSVTYFCRNILPSMIKEKRGRIINISSMWGVYGASCEAAYSATKGGINSYTKALGKELAPCHIPVNAIAFGAVDTRMNSHLSEEEKTALCDLIPYGRMATVREAAEMIYNLFTAPAYLTSQVIGFDGGF